MIPSAPNIGFTRPASPPSPRDRRAAAFTAFTLPEILVTTATIAILVAIGLTSARHIASSAAHTTAQRNAHTIATISAAAVAGGSPVFAALEDGELDRALGRLKATPVITLPGSDKPLHFNIGTYSQRDLDAAKSHLEFTGGRLLYRPDHR